MEANSIIVRAVPPTYRTMAEARLNALLAATPIKSPIREGVMWRQFSAPSSMDCRCQASE
jgi:hypothetical protein